MSSALAELPMGLAMDRSGPIALRALGARTMPPRLCREVVPRVTRRLAASSGANGRERASLAVERIGSGGVAAALHRCERLVERGTETRLSLGIHIHRLEGA